MKTKNNKVKNTILIVILVMSVLALYVPLLFPPQDSLEINSVNTYSQSQENYYQNETTQTVSSSEATVQNNVISTSSPNYER